MCAGEGCTDQVRQVDGGACDGEAAGVQLRQLQQRINHHGQLITGLINGEQEFPALLPRGAPIQAQEGFGRAFD